MSDYAILWPAGDPYPAKNLAINRGDALTLTFRIRKGDGTARDLTGYSIVFTAKTRLSDTDANAVLQKRTSAGTISVADPVGGNGSLTILAGDTITLSAETRPLFFDMQINDGAGGITTVASGTLIVEPRATITAT